MLWKKAERVHPEGGTRSIRLYTYLFFLLVCMGGVDADAFSPEDNYLWIEFGECTREGDGSLTLPLRLHYGRFPDEKQEIGGLDDISGCYTRAAIGDKGEPLLYGAEIEKNGQGYFVHINSLQENRFTLFVEAEKKQQGGMYRYLAKTSFVLFGHAVSQDKRMWPLPTHEINRQLELCIHPEFRIWSQTGNPVRITTVSSGTGYVARKAISIFDENMPLTEMVTDEKGDCIYLPPEDKKLNSKGETAFKQAVIVAEETTADIIYISSYTLILHRSRFKNYRLSLGAVIFFGTLMSVWLFVLVKRKRFQF